MPKIYTIGFSGKTKDQFMEVLDAVGVKKLIDIRLWRVARFVPWASGANLTVVLGDIRYRYIPELAPTKELLAAYKGGMVDWAGYEKIFNNLLRERRVENLFMSTSDKRSANSYKFARSEASEKLFASNEWDGMCLLCSEKTADKCHRRLVAEYMAAHFPGTEIVHL